LGDERWRRKVAATGMRLGRLRGLAGPEGAVVPVDAVAAVGDDASDDGAGPVCGELVARIPGAGGTGIGFVGQAICVAAAANGAALRAIAAAIPRTFDSRTAPAASASVVAALPVGAVGPIDLRAVGSERAGDKLPAGRGHDVRSLQSAGRGVALFVCEIEENAAVAGDRGLLVGVALRAPLAEEGCALIPLRERSGDRVRGMNEDCEECSDGEAGRVQRKRAKTWTGVRHFLSVGGNNGLRGRLIRAKPDSAAGRVAHSVRQETSGAEAPSLSDIDVAAEAATHKALEVAEETDQNNDWEWNSEQEQENRAHLFLLS
jgi:hypothetical protein